MKAANFEAAGCFQGVRLVGAGDGDGEDGGVVGGFGGFADDDAGGGVGEVPDGGVASVDGGLAEFLLQFGGGGGFVGGDDGIDESDQLMVGKFGVETFQAGFGVAIFQAAVGGGMSGDAEDGNVGPLVTGGARFLGVVALRFGMLGEEGFEGFAELVALELEGGGIGRRGLFG